MRAVIGGSGSAIRMAALAGTVLMLTAATFSPGPLQSVAVYTRYGLAVVLFLLTLHQGAGTRRSLAIAPPSARRFVMAAWLLVAIASCLAPFSIAPVEVLSQTAVFALLIGTVHVNVTHRWHNSAAVGSDLRVIFWALTVPVAASLAVGRLHEPRLSGLFDNPNTLAIVSAMTVALGAGLVAEQRSRLVLMVIAINFVALLRTESRTALVALLIAGVLLTARGLRRLPVFVVLGACFAGAAAAVAVMTTGRLPMPSVVTRFGIDDEYGPLNTRDAAWEYALELWSREPLTGYGFRVGEVAFEQYRFLTSFRSDGVHNSYLQTLLEIGLIGYVPFVAMLVILGGVVLRTVPHGIAVGAHTVVVVGLVAATAESFMFGLGQSMSWVFWLVAAAATVLAPVPEQRIAGPTVTNRFATGEGVG